MMNVHYWSGGPGRYLGAEHIPIHVTDGDGKSCEIVFGNGQAKMGSGVSFPIRPGESLAIPAALAPLPPGTYTIAVGTGKGVKIVIQNDPERLKAFEKTLLERARKKDRFAIWVAGEYPMKGLTSTLLHDLESADIPAASLAVEVLSVNSARKLPADYGPSLARALVRHRESPGNFFRGLVWLCVRVGTEEMLDALLPLAADDRWAVTAGQALATFQQERAITAARDLLKHPNKESRFHVARALAGRRDPAALEVLLDVAREPGKWRGYACEELAKYPHDDRVIPVLESATLDDNTFARDLATWALARVRKLRAE
jgi:hypothetical protein